jgi:NAD(P)-dependent dehydrogenase (short-subunit alcohol dehydrogenase family)
VAAITGAGSGIGRALAHEFVRQGARVSLSDVNEEGLAETEAQLQAKGHQPFVQRVDVAVRDEVEAWAAATEDHFGSVHLIVNNAGVALSGTVDALAIEDYEWIMAINFWGVVYGTKAFLPRMEAAGEGHVVNISSVFGLTSQPLMSGYNASKFAVRGFTESLRQDLELRKSCVSTTCVHPGGIRTNIARDSRVDPSVQHLTGRTPEQTTRDFERLFLTTPESAARTIVRAVQHNARRVLVGPDARLFDWAVRLMPTGYQWLFTEAIRRQRR